MGEGKTIVEKDKIRVSFVILNYNSTEETLACIHSIYSHCQSVWYEIIVVDNRSRADEVQKLKSSLDGQCTVIENKLNFGFGGGNMIGANFAQGNFLCFLNSDIQLVEDCVTPLCEDMLANPTIGCITPQQYNMHGKLVPAFKHTLGFRRAILGDDLFERFYPRKFPNRKHPPKSGCFSVPEINGCFMLFPAKTFWEIGGFDSNIFLFYEEYDISQRLRMKGYLNVVDSRYSFRHVHGACMNKVKGITTRERYLSRIYCYAKYHGIMMTLLFKSLTLVQLVFKPRKWFVIPALIGDDVLSRSMRHLV